MRVHVDDARRDDQSLGVDRRVGACAIEPGERGDASGAHTDVDPPAREAGAVDDETAPDDEVEVAHVPAGWNVAAPERTTRNVSPSRPAANP